MTGYRVHLQSASLVLLAIALPLAGCATLSRRPEPPPAPHLHGPMPRELSKVALPTYRIEPPDILIVEALQTIPKAPYQLRTTDILSIQVEGTLPNAPIAGAFAVESGGFVNLGFPYGRVRVADLTPDQAKQAIEDHLRQYLREPFVSVSLLELAGRQQIAGEHLVGPDGTLTLGSYGSVSVVGMTLEQAKLAIENHLRQFLDSPEVSVTVAAFNSKVYYVITEGAGTGDRVTRLPVTGNETVLDAIANINGLTELSSKRIWIARPSPHTNNVQVLPVDWKAITAQASTASNYQVMPGDRIFVAEDEMVALDTRLAKFLAPIERAMGFSLLGVGVATRFSGPVLQGGGARGFAFGN